MTQRQLVSRLSTLTVYNQEEVEPKLAELAGRGAAALYIVIDPVIFAWRASILATAARHVCQRLAASGWGRSCVFGD